ncbi:LytR/AlgR family response regulator transcription factor [Sphingomonas radiodurans]|uniref:LytR/AlgR family response regulator transcription factor n=1 Tax=Sphingomonas radiodurans TaxID=2890321 RepID=UPI001E2D7190|nr:response regulator [Sphingomonas radiodurans]WBH15792.1 response regulator [Sphingomonas radiodurans]
MSATVPHIVLVDDEEDLREPTAAYLSDQGLDVSEADGGRALDAVLATRPADLVVLDVNMPEEDGFSIARRLRATGSPIGIIMLTARRDVIDRIAGLELGADDYVMKPFEPGELLARIRTVLRRTAAASLPVESKEHTTPAPTGGYQSEFWIPTGRGQVRVAVETIEWIEAAKDYALFHTADRSHMVRATMAALEAALDPAHLIRVHRSAFVQLNAVQAINQIGRHTTLLLKSGATVKVGPQHVNAVRQRLRR